MIVDVHEWLKTGENINEKYRDSSSRRTSRQVDLFSRNLFIFVMVKYGVLFEVRTN
jgi:hypothetical protein